MPGLSTTKKRKSPTERVDDDSPLKNNAVPTCSCSIGGYKNSAPGVGGMCIKHGGKRICSQEGCDRTVQNRGVCISHGAMVYIDRCSIEGCDKHERSQGVCILHGATEKRCSVDGFNYTNGKENSTRGIMMISEWSYTAVLLKGVANIHTQRMR